MSYRSCCPLCFAAGRLGVNLIRQALTLFISTGAIIALSGFCLIAIAMAWPVISLTEGLAAQFTDPEKPMGSVTGGARDSPPNRNSGSAAGDAAEKH